MDSFIEQSLYNEVLKNMPIVCVDVICLYRGNYLLIKRKNEPAKNQYWFPGGRIRKHEKMEDSVKRICKDECNLEVVIKRKIGFDETIFSSGPNNIPIHSINLVFLVECLNNNVQLDENHEDFNWVNISKIPDNLHPYLSHFLQTVFME